MYDPGLIRVKSSGVTFLSPHALVGKFGCDYSGGQVFGYKVSDQGADANPERIWETYDGVNREYEEAV